MRTEDGDIIQECLNGKPEAFGILVDKYKAGIYAFVYSELANFHDAQDVTQEAFLQAYRGLRKLRVWESFSFWLYCIARNLCKKWINNKAKRPDKDFIDDQDPKILDTPSLNSHHENQIFQSLQETLDTLPEDYRQVLTLHYFGGMKIKDMARALSVPPTTIAKRLSRARMMLKEEMIAMMGTVFEEQKLRSIFTFRIVEIAKRIRIQPTTIKSVPWGLSVAIGLIAVIMSINPALISFENIGAHIFSPMPVETKVLKVGEIPVDVVKTSNISFISSNEGKGKGGELKPDMENAFFMAPQGEGGEWTRKADMPTARVDLRTGVV
jgi:RNA polymerase sigma-70 factor (ECF subfamily)